MPREAIEIIDVNSTGLFLPEGEVYDWVEKVTRSVGREARLLCPPLRSKRTTSRYVPTGRLRASIKTKTRMDGTRLDVGTISVGPAIDPLDKHHHDYSTFVLGGTAYQGMRYIYSREGYAHKAIIDAVIGRRGIVNIGLGQGIRPKDMQGRWAMRFRTDGGRHFRVHGQKRNPFLFEAHNKVALRHPSMGQFAVPWF